MRNLEAAYRIDRHPQRIVRLAARVFRSQVFARRAQQAEHLRPVESLPLVRAVTDRKPAHGPLVITGRDGRERTIEITAFPLEGGRGRLLGGVAMFWERTEP